MNKTYIWEIRDNKGRLIETAFTERDAKDYLHHDATYYYIRVKRPATSQEIMAGSRF